MIIHKLMKGILLSTTIVLSTLAQDTFAMDIEPATYQIWISSFREKKQENMFRVTWIIPVKPSFLKKPESENFSLSGSLVSNFSLPGEEESDTEHVSDLILDEDFILQPKNRKMFLILLTGHFSIRGNHWKSLRAHTQIYASSLKI